MFAYKCTVTYEGTRYNGWQKQNNTQNTIQEKIENVLSRMLDESIEIHGSGRTDAGVHALCQVFHFHCKNAITTDYTKENFLTKLNGYLPGDIRIIDVSTCDLRFHARLNATDKVYQYHIDTSPYGNIFYRNICHHIPKVLDLNAMKEAANLLEGTHDYKAFCSNKRLKKSSIRTIYAIDIKEDTTNQHITISYHGNGFLYNMVRIMTGTLIEIGLHVKSPKDISIAFEKCDRAFAGHTAPPQGLFLVSVSYADN